MVEGRFAHLLFPGIKKIFFDSFKEAKPVGMTIFNADKSNQAWEDDLSMAGFELLQRYGELEDIPIREARQGFRTRYIHRKWGSGYRISWEALQDSVYPDVLKKLPSQLARSARATKETIFASVINNGFNASFTGADGKSLFAIDHPLAGMAGGTSQNRFSGAIGLSQTSLKEAVTQLKRTKASDDIFSPVTGPFTLLVPDQLEHRANEIVGTPTTAYSTDNTINVVNRMNMKVMPWSYLTDETNWFLLGPKDQTMLRYYERWPIRQDTENITIKQCMIHIIYERYAVGWSDWRGTWGAEGS